MPLATEIQKDELLHSFLVRRLINSGRLSRFDDLKSFMRNISSWENVPKIPKKYQFLFKGLTWETRLEMVRSNTTLWEQNVITNPDLLASLSQSVFAGTKLDPVFENSKRLLPITYCPICFKTQMSNHGFTWFKVNWCHSLYCARHRKRLKLAGCAHCKSRLVAHSLLKATFAGRCPRCSKMTWENPKDLKATQLRVFADYWPYRNIKLNSGLYFTPCYLWGATNLLLPTMIRNVFRDPKSATPSADKLIRIYSYAKKFRSTRTSVSIVNAHILCDRLESTEHPTIDRWMKDRCEIVKIETFPSDQETIRQTLIRTLRNRTCKNCVVSISSCPLQPNSRTFRHRGDFKRRDFLARLDQPTEPAKAKTKHCRPWFS